MAAWGICFLRIDARCYWDLRSRGLQRYTAEAGDRDSDGARCLAGAGSAEDCG